MLGQEYELKHKKENIYTWSGFLRKASLGLKIPPEYGQTLGDVKFLYWNFSSRIMLTRYVNSYYFHFYISREYGSFQMEVVKKSFMKTLPTYTLPKNWSNLPLELKQIKSLKVFKNSNKDKILSSYNVSCTANNCYSCQS